MNSSAGTSGLLAATGSILPNGANDIWIGGSRTGNVATEGWAWIDGTSAANLNCGSRGCGNWVTLGAPHGAQPAYVLLQFALTVNPTRPCMRVLLVKLSKGILSLRLVQIDLCALAVITWVRNQASQFHLAPTSTT